MNALHLAAFVAACLLSGSQGAAIEGVPSFTWDETRSSSDGVPHLIISFPDGGPDDVALLQPRRNLLMADQDFSDTAFFGTLQNDPKVFLAVNGKPKSDYFEVLLNSGRLSKTLYIYENGVVRGVEPLHQDPKIATDGVPVPEADRDLFDESMTSSNKVSSDGCIGGATYNLYVNVDATFQAYLGSDAAITTAVTEILNGADIIYKWTELSPCATLYLNVVGVQKIADSLTASTNDLNQASSISSGNPVAANAYAYLCYQNDLPGTIGLAWVRSTCGTKYYKSAVVERFQSNSQTSQVLSHELGHNLGMGHDFDSNTQGHSCPDQGGVMDYNQPYYYQWTVCSKEDFQSYVQYVESTQGGYCLS